MDKSLQIAQKALRQCYDKCGIVAGKNHFDFYWARDAFYACWGALELKDYEIVKKNLTFFLSNLGKDGQVPIRIGSTAWKQNLALIGIKTKKNNTCEFNQDKGYSKALDPNLLLLITLEKYVKKTNDTKLLKKYLIKINYVLNWLEEKEEKGLLKGGNYATWQDMIKKNGFVLYTNVLYYQALVSAGNIFDKLKIKNKHSKKAQKLKNLINEKFWNEKHGHYNDFFNEKKTSEVFSSDGNFFSVVFGVSDMKRTKRILENADKLGISEDVPSYTNFPKHGGSEVFLPYYLIGMQDYNDYGVCWTWIGCLHSIALSKAGRKKRSKEVLDKLSRLIIKDGDVYEVYDKKGYPLKRWIYKSEHPFSWTASLYIVAKKLQ